MSTRLTNGIYTFTNGEDDWGTLMNANLQELDNLVGDHGDTVSFSQTLTSGVKIGKITINGTEIELYHTDYSGKADATSVYTKTEVNNFLEEKADALNLTSHTDNDDIHVTTLEKETWTNKQDALTDEQLENINSISELDEKYISADDTTIIRLKNDNEVNLQEDHYNAWFGYRGGEVTNWKFGNGSEGGYANVYANDFYLNDESLSDLLDSKANADNVYTKTEVDTSLSAKANDNNVVHKSGNETVGGTKTFSATNTYFSYQLSVKSNIDYSLGVAPASTSYQYIFFTNKDGGYGSGYIEQVMGTDGSGCQNLVSKNINGQGTSIKNFIDAQGNKSLYPEVSNATNLGTSTHKWKTINGVDIGALSLPNIANGINIDTTNWDLSGVANSFTPTSDGYIYFRVEHTSTLPKIAWYINSYNAYSDNRTISTTGALSSGFIPVIANTPISVLITATSIRSAKFYPCVGNV